MVKSLLIAMSALTLVTITPAALGNGATCFAASGKSTAALLELYTSQGCDSCPPADQWVGGLAKRGFGTDRLVPLALHVDYWDYLGWKDPFARAAYTTRQREVVGLAGSRVVYTPQILVNGRDYRRWSNERTFAADLKIINDRPPRATIALTLKLGSQGAAEFVAMVGNVDPAQRADAALYVAFYEDGLATSVTAGENKGVRLKHERVVRELLGPFGIDQSGKTEQQRAVMLPPGAKIAGAVAFVQNRRNAEVLQALDLAACAG